MSNEKEIVGGVEIIANLKLALGEAVSQLAQLEKRGLSIKPTIDKSGVEEIAKTSIAADKEVTRERETNLRQLASLNEQLTRHQLQQEMKAVNESKRLKDQLAGYQLKQESGIDSARWKQAAEGNVAITKAIDTERRRELDALKAGIKGRHEETKEGKTLADMLKDFGQGMPPRRTLSQLFTGGLQSMGFGEGSASLLGGTGGLLAGSMVFRMGWGMMGALEQIPEKIADTIRENQQIDVRRAGLVGRASTPGTLAPIQAGTLTDAEKQADDTLLGAEKAGLNIFNRVGNAADAGNDFIKVLESLQVESNKTITDQAERAKASQRNVEYAKIAESGKLFAGIPDALQMANALREMGWSNVPGVGPGQETPETLKAIQTLLNMPGISKILTDAERKRRELPADYSDAQIWAETKRGYEDMATSQSSFMRDKARKEIFNAIANAMAYSDNVQGQAQTALNQNHPMIALGEALEEVVGNQQKLSFDERKFVRSYQAIREGHSNWPMGSVPGKSAAEAESGSSQTEDPRAVGYIPPARRHELAAIAEAHYGNWPGFMGSNPPEPYGGVMPPNPQFSFMGAEQLVHKMQMNAGFNMGDSGDRTAANTEIIATKMDELITAVGSQGGDTKLPYIGNWGYSCKDSTHHPYRRSPHR